MTLAERAFPPDVAADPRQVARHLDHASWTAIAAAETAIGRLANERLATLVPAGTRETLVRFAIRAIEGALRYGRPSSGARDTAWALAVLGGNDPFFMRRVEAVYDAVGDAVQQVAPAAEGATRSATRSILDEASVIAERAGAKVGPVALAPDGHAASPIPPLAFRALADLPHVAYVVDRALRYAFVNRAWEAFARENQGDACLPAAIVGRSWVEAISGPDRAHWLAVAEQVLDGAIPSYREEIPCHSLEACRFILVTVAPLRLADDADAEIVGLVFVTYDITEQRRAETERLWLEQEGRRVRDVFLGTVAHDLRNPLAAIKGRAQLLRRRAERATAGGPSGLEEGLSAIEASADQMVGQIDELLEVAQVQAGQPMRLRRRPTDLVALVRGVVAANEHLLGGHRLRLDLPAPGLVGEWDEVRLRRVVTNLLTNAAKYSPDGGEIAIAAWREDAEGRAWAAVSVRDQGIGIPAADLPKIFSSYFRGSNVSAGTGGFGLGLAGAYQIVTEHGGRLSVESEVGVGTEFTVRLPLDG